MVSRDDLAKCHTREAAHLNGGSEWFGYIHVVVEHPRLSRFDKYTRKDRGVHSTWRVDGIDQESLEAALAALDVPPTLSPKEREALILWRDNFESAWRDRASDYETFAALGWKALIDGKRGITAAGLAALAADA